MFMNFVDYDTLLLFVRVALSREMVCTASGQKYASILQCPSAACFPFFYELCLNLKHAYCNSNLIESEALLTQIFLEDIISY